MLRRQKSCSVCGFACLSTWRSVIPSKPFICESCRSKDLRPNISVDTADTSKRVNDGGRHHHSDLYSTLNSGHEGNNKTHQKTTEENPACMINLKPDINVRKKKRSKLPQYTLSPIGRFINQLQQIAQEPEYKARRDDDDGVLLYERCNNFIPSNEIGLGAELISSKSISSSSSSCSRKDGEAYNKPKKKCHKYRRSESASNNNNNNEDEGSCLFDVPIMSP